MDARALLRLEAELEYGVTLQGNVIPVTMVRGYAGVFSGAVRWGKRGLLLQRA